MTTERNPTKTAGATLDVLLEFVKSTRGFDFTGYKRSSIERRVAKRMQEVGVEAVDDYIDYLELHAEEFAELFNTILINVTSFFRDPAAWDYLTREVVPRLVATRSEDVPLRVWCAGASSGEEAYTVAMCFANVLGDDAFRDRVKIYATDVDDAALDTARQGAYPPRQIEAVPPEALERFFERTDQRYVFRKDLRRSVIFGRNDLVQDAPISRIDLLVCRNTLMYFTAETQAQILRRFHFALDPQGYLMLGKSEMLITHSDLFAPVELKQRLFRKVRAAARERPYAALADPSSAISSSISGDLREVAFDIGGPAQLVVDGDGTVMMINEAARRTFGLGTSDLGRPIQDLEISYRPVELRSQLDAMESAQKPIDIKGVRWRVKDQERVMDVRLTPLLSDSVRLGTGISYRDVTDEHELTDQLSRSKRELETAYEELNSTVEELETTNEELQSTNEELETMNDELRSRTLELNDMNAFLETILTTIGFAVAVLDRNQHVRIWNSEARELWGVTQEEVEDQHLLSLDIGLPVDKLRSSLRTVLQGGSEKEEVVLDATNRRGRAFRCRVTVLPLGGASIDGVPGAIVTMETAGAE